MFVREIYMTLHPTTNMQSRESFLETVHIKCSEWLSKVAQICTFWRSDFDLVTPKAMLPSWPDDSMRHFTVIYTNDRANSVWQRCKESFSAVWNVYKLLQFCYFQEIANQELANLREQKVTKPGTLWHFLKLLHTSGLPGAGDRVPGWAGHQPSHSLRPSGRAPQEVTSLLA